MQGPVAATRSVAVKARIMQECDFKRFMDNNSSLPQLHKVDAIAILILQIRKRRHRRVTCPRSACLGGAGPG